jgi:DNA-binding CsgD family transcriptional regulator
LFVGRRHELETMRAALREARLGRGRLVLVSGEPGIGKTRTAAELAADAARDGASLIWGRCHEESGAPPYWPWAQILRALLSDGETAELRQDLGAGAVDIADIVPEIRDRLPGLEASTPARDPGEARFRLFDSLSRFLIAAARRRPLLIVLDDLHWADVPSLRFLEFLTPEIGDSHLLLIGTYRENELSRRHPLSDALGGLGRVAHATRIHLAGLGHEETQDFIAQAAGVSPPPALTRSIQRQTEGNPLFLREVVSFLRHQGHFDSLASGQAAASAVRIPEGVREAIGRRLNTLSASCNELLALASVIGREFSLDVLTRAAGDRAGDQVSRAIDEALDARVVEELAPDQYQFTHALIRMTLYDELRTGQRRRLHRAVGEAIETLYRRDVDRVLPDLAYHFQAAGPGDGMERAVRYSMRAGQRANAVLAFEDAIGFFRGALDTIDQMADFDPRLHAELLLQLAETFLRVNDFTSAKDRAREAATMARAHGLHEILAEAAFAFQIAEFRDRFVTGEDTADFLEDVLSVVPESLAAARIKVMVALARAKVFAGALEEAKALAFETVARARALGDPAVLARSLDLAYEFSFLPDERPRLVAYATEMTELAERTGDLEMAWRGWFQRSVFHLELGELEETRSALQAFNATTERLRQLRQPFFHLFGTVLNAAFAFFWGDLPETERLLLQAMRIRGSGRWAAADVASNVIFDLRRAQGRLSELAPIARHFASQPAHATWRPGLALLHLECGDVAAARALFEDLATNDFAAVARDARWAPSVVYLSEICAALGDASRAATLYAFLLPWSGINIAVGSGSSFPGTANRFLGLLATTMRRWTDAESHFESALAMCERTAGLTGLAHTRFDFANMLLARGFPGDRARAAVLLRNAENAAAALGLVALGRRVGQRIAELDVPAQTAPDDLTVRELEVLRLMAIGRGNADIALVLSISLNTVATHVRNILAKTGCANRTEAAAYAMRHGLHAAG